MFKNISDDKMVLPKLIEGLRHLRDCGICFEGIDLNDSFLLLQKDIEIWFEKELFSLKEK